MDLPVAASEKLPFEMRDTKKTFWSNVVKPVTLAP